LGVDYRVVRIAGVRFFPQRIDELENPSMDWFDNVGPGEGPSRGKARNESEMTYGEGNA
jgi:hypothetical protein